MGVGGSGRKKAKGRELERGDGARREGNGLPTVGRAWEGDLSRERKTSPKKELENGDGTQKGRKGSAFRQIGSGSLHGAGT